MSKINATIRYAGDDFYVVESHGGHAQVLETNGKRGRAVTPVELLLLALGGCTGSDVVATLQKKRQTIVGYRAEITGERREEAPRSFRTIHVHHVITGHNVSERAVSQAIELSDTKYCSVAATLRPTVQISTSFEIIQAPEAAEAAGA
jgi:putative redox protein